MSCCASDRRASICLSGWARSWQWSCFWSAAALHRRPPTGGGCPALACLLAGIHLLVGPLLLLLSGVRWQGVGRGHWSGPTLAVLRGLLLALPLVLLFGALFVNADAVFEQMVSGLLDLNFGDLMSHLLGAAVWAWLAAAFLHGLLLSKDAGPVRTEHPAALTLGGIEIGIVMGLLNALFLAFVLVQFRYFFGGAALVEASTGLTFAAYARRGFFELVGVAALVLPVLLWAHWLLPAQRPDLQHRFRYLAGGLVALLFVIMASALQRMRLYQHEFGLTELRLYATAFMNWLAVLCVWFCATVLRGRREWFAVGGLVTALVFTFALHGLNPDAFVVRVNVERITASRRLDVHYLTNLSADAVPALVAALPRLTESDQKVVAERILARWSVLERRDWRTWNWGRGAALWTLALRRATLERMANTP